MIVYLSLAWNIEWHVGLAARNMRYEWYVKEERVVSKKSDGKRGNDGAKTAFYAHGRVWIPHCMAIHHVYMFWASDCSNRRFLLMYFDCHNGIITSLSKSDATKTMVTTKYWRRKKNIPTKRLVWRQKKKKKKKWTKRDLNSFKSTAI